MTFRVYTSNYQSHRPSAEPSQAQQGAPGNREEIVSGCINID